MQLPSIPLEKFFHGLASGLCFATIVMLREDSLKRLLQGRAVGAVAAMFIGFYWGGWSLASTAEKIAKERSELAVVAALSPVCADKFRALPDADAKKVALSKASWKRRDEFPTELVTLPGILPEFRPYRRVFRAIASTEVGRAQLR
jgi:hypothetical protein